MCAMGESAQKRPRDKLANILAIILVGSIALYGVGMFAPLSTPRITLNHIRAGRNVRLLITAENAFSGKFPDVGFTCELHNLERIAESSDGVPIIDSVLASGEKAAYHYELSGCQQHEKAAHYVITAVPTKPGVVGKYPFCADERGVVWYDDSGSNASCLAEHWPWKEVGSR
jgi:hypothetical protein